MQTTKHSMVSLGGVLLQQSNNYAYKVGTHLLQECIEISCLFLILLLTKHEVCQLLFLWVASGCGYIGIIKSVNDVIV